MSNEMRSPVLAARVSSQTKAQFAAIARQQGLSESALLKSIVTQLIDREPRLPAPRDPDVRAFASDRITLRLRRGDRTLISRLAASRRLRPSSYLVMLIHAHVRRVDLLAPADTDDLKRAVSTLGSLARAIQSGPGDPRADWAALLQATHTQIDVVRHEVSSLVQRQLIRWEADDE